MSVIEVIVCAGLSILILAAAALVAACIIYLVNEMRGDE